MEAESYYTAWWIYLAAVVIAQLCFWWLIRKIGNGTIKVILQLMLLSVLITPAIVEPGQDYWVPAFMVALMNWLDFGLDAAMPRLQTILTVMVLMVVLFVAGKVAVAKWRAKPDSETEKGTH